MHDDFVRKKSFTGWKQGHTPEIDFENPAFGGVSFWKPICPFVDLADENHGDGERSTILLNGADPLMQASISYSLQIALAAVLALATAQALQLPDAYWAPISAIVCSLEAFDRAFETARRRLIGTLLGVGLAAVQVSFVQQSLLTYGLCIGDCWDGFVMQHGCNRAHYGSERSPSPWWSPKLIKLRFGLRQRPAALLM